MVQLAKISRPIVSRSNRRAITILEVLIAIAVVSIGLFGVMAVLPLAIQRANRAAIFDDAAAAGSNAVDEFQLRGMNNPGNWLAANGTNITALGNPNGYCIDPLFLAQGLPAVTGGNPAAFPYGKNATIAMQRVTLKNNVGPATGGVDLATADLFFTLRDDLRFSPPDANDRNALQAPVQEFIRVDPSNAASAPLKRAINGRTTWFATLCRANSGSDMWNLSVVILNNRKFDMPVSDDNPTPAFDDARRQNEQVAQITSANFASGGYRGGDVVISGTTPESVEVRTGNWVMLSGAMPSGLAYHRWYRVASADPESSGTAIPGVWTRNITLQGSDWPIGASGTMANPQVTIVRNVVAVFEKTVRLDNTPVDNVWAN